ncbi:competence/damage-inducible protein A [Anaerospora sp.]|uniref:competence/damage-inducible protein A n=1 Tax=Anaerospora sp. TaxID=1960278 RepID=UPI0028A044BF|nr:competence/damage-inducible protein A [Anaerospora sp.]
MMIVEIVTTGTELLLGQIINTNSAWLSQQLNALGFNVMYQSTVGDNRERMAQVFATALNRADIVITSGGLGPTLGDITKEVSANLVNRKLCQHAASAAKIEAYFSKRGITMPESNLRQALIPLNSIVLDNDSGTAPGVIIEENNKVIIHLPGPPNELKAMFSQKVIPYLQERYFSQGVILSRVLRVYGIGESSLEASLQDLVEAQGNPTIALLVKKSEIHIRLTAKCKDECEAQTAIQRIEKIIRDRLGDAVFGADSDSLEMVVGSLFREKELTVALAESCTGGLISSRLTDIAGSSDYVIGGIVCYSNAIKSNFVGVPNEILENYGAVSEPTALSMASNIRNKFGASIGIGVTGIAGPGGAVADKPVGLVYIAIDGPQGSRCFRFEFLGKRKEIKQRTSQAALFELRRYALEI